MIKRLPDHLESMRTGLALITGLVLVLLAGTAVGTPQIMTAYGDQMPWFSSEVNAMGGTGTALYRGGISNIFNPACLAEADSVRMDLGLTLDQQHEDRFQPLFDSFESYVADAAIASSRHHFWQTGFGLAAPVTLYGRSLSVGVSLVDRYPFTYTFDEELRNPSPYTSDGVRDVVIQRRIREVTGTLRNLSLGLGTALHERVAVGMALHYAFGTRSDLRSVRNYGAPDSGYPEEDSFSEEDSFPMSGLNYTLGLTGKINERVEVGVAWESRLKATGTWDYTYADAEIDTLISHPGKYLYPSIFRAGLVFRPRTDPRTIFTIELEYVPWEDLTDNEHPGGDNPQNLQSTTDVRVGLEHMFYNGMPLRFGFRHLQTYADAEASVSVFSAGVGMPVLRGMLSASLELSKLTSILDHQFPYPEGYFDRSFVSDPQARVEDTRFRLSVGYKRNF